jgi:ribosomal-protein-alanine N-acetyltransferase
VNGLQQLHLRPARSADLGQVLAIEERSFSDPWPRAALLSELQADQMRMPMVAERDGRVVAYLMAWQVVDHLHVLNLAVAKEQRRLGIGSQLLLAALREAIARGLRIATLEVRPSNTAARAFYEQHGFVVVGRRRRYYADTGEDAIIMNRSLRSGVG